MNLPSVVELRKTVDNDTTLIYRYKNDYRDFTIFFFKDKKTYSVEFSAWDDNEHGDFVPMDERTKAVKHSSHYGMWVRAEYEMTIGMHNFITKVMQHLGWIR